MMNSRVLAEKLDGLAAHPVGVELNAPSHFRLKGARSQYFR